MPLAAIVFCSSSMSFCTGSRITFCKSCAAVVIESGKTLTAFILTSLVKSSAVLIPVSSPATTPTACRRCLLATLVNILVASAVTMLFLAPAAAIVRSTFITLLAFLNSVLLLNPAPSKPTTEPTTPNLSNQSDQPSQVLSAPVATSCTTLAACQLEMSIPSCKSR